MNIDREILPISGYSGDVGYPDMSTVPGPCDRAGRVGNPTPTSSSLDSRFRHAPLEIARGRRSSRAVDGLAGDRATSRTSDTRWSST